MKLSTKILLITLCVTGMPTLATVMLLGMLRWSQEKNDESQLHSILLTNASSALTQAAWQYDNRGLELSGRSLFRSRPVLRFQAFSDRGEDLIHLVRVGDQIEALPPESRSDQSEFTAFSNEGRLDSQKLAGVSTEHPLFTALPDDRIRLTIPLWQKEDGNAAAKLVGLATLEYTTRYVKEKLFHIAWIGLLTTAGFMLIVISLLFWFLKYYFIEPLANLAEASERLAEGNFEKSINSKNQDEIGILAKNLDGMRLKVKDFKLDLTQKNQLLAQSLESFQHEVSTRVNMVQDLAHRGNNPMNAISLSLHQLRILARDLQLMILHILGPKDQLDPDGLLCYQNFDLLFQDIFQNVSLSQENLLRVEKAVKDIRILSGVDGYSCSWVDISRVMEQVTVRLLENLGRTAEERLYWEWVDNSETRRLLSHELVLTYSLERFVRLLLNITSCPLHIQLSMLTHLDHQRSLSLRFLLNEPLLTDDIEQLVRLLSYSLQGFLVKPTWDGRSLLFQSIPPPSTEQISSSTEFIAHEDVA